MKHYLEKIEWPVIGCVNYKNCLVWKAIGGFIIFGKLVSKPEQVDEVINESIKSLGNSIKRG